MSSEIGGHCYCGMPEISSMYHFVCDKCKRKFHEGASTYLLNRYLCENTGCLNLNIDNVSVTFIIKVYGLFG